MSYELNNNTLILTEANLKQVINEINVIKRMFLESWGEGGMYHARLERTAYEQILEVEETLKELNQFRKHKEEGQ